MSRDKTTTTGKQAEDLEQSPAKMLLDAIACKDLKDPRAQQEWAEKSAKAFFGANQGQPNIKE